jgi:hypothetical protein
LKKLLIHYQKIVRQSVLSYLFTRRKTVSEASAVFFLDYYLVLDKWTNLGLLHDGFRKVNSSPKMGSQRHHSQMAGKEMPVSMLLGSQGKGSLVHPLMPLELHKILARFGKRKLSKPRGQQLAIDVASHSFKVIFNCKKLPFV